MGWLLSFHLIGIVIWIGGLMNLGRLLGTHAKIQDESGRADLIPFEKKSYWFGIFPGFLLTVGTGLAMLFMVSPKIYLSPSQGVWGATFHIKLLLVAFIIILDQFMAMKMRRLQKTGQGSRGLFMAVHGIIGIFFVIIVILMETRIMA